MSPWLTVVGIGEDGWRGLSRHARQALLAADTIFGAARHLALLPTRIGGERRAWPTPFTIAPPNTAVYTATKASVDAVSSVLSKELTPRKIRVNTVNPGMIATEGVVSAGMAEGDMRKWIESITPLGRIGKVEEIAAAVAFFASNDASYITGETLHVTGGLH